MEQLSFFVERKSSKWLKDRNMFKHIDCGFWYLDSTQSPFRYCPKCGCFMEGYIVK